jgi:hypothetical protein
MFTYFRLKEQAKMQWLEDGKQSIVDNTNNVRPEAYKHFRKKKNEYVKAKID